MPDRPAGVAEVPEVEWAEFQSQVFNTDTFHQGEHVSLIGPTGFGKTTMGFKIAALRDYVVLLHTKPRDGLISKEAKSWKWQEEFNPRYGYPRIVLHPPIKDIKFTRAQYEVFNDALHEIYRQEGWTVWADEASYLTDRELLGIRRPMLMLWQQGRSLDITVIAATQRPRYIPLAAYSQATHLFLWGSHDEADIKRLSEIGGADTKTLKWQVQHMPSKYHVLYVRPQDEVVVMTKIEK